MSKIAMELSPQEAEHLAALLVGRLTLPAKRRLSAVLDREVRQSTARAARFRALLRRIDRRVRRNPRVIRALMKDAQIARREFYAARGHRY